MKTNTIPLLLGTAAGVLLAGGAVYTAYRGNLAPAVILIACQAAAFVIFVRALLSKSPRSREPSTE